MKIGFFAFTGTGNTLRVCNILASELSANGVESELNLLKNVKDANIQENYDKLIIAYPVHGFNTPMPMLNFLKSLPKCENNKSVYIMRISGEPLKLNNAAGIVPKRILRKKGYCVKGESMYIMPYNIIFHHTDNMATRMENAAKIKAKKDVADIIADNGKLCKNGIFNRIVSFVCRAEHIAMPAMGKHYKATDACIGCGICEKLCPTNNIKLINDKPVFGKNCVGCMGCAFDCPKDAIRTSLLNGWRVNGAYNFHSTPAKDEEICDYCKKSYLNYFHEVESNLNE